LVAAVATAALQEEMKALVSSIPDGAGAAFTAMQLQELEQQSRVYQYMAARVPVPTHLVFPIWKCVTGASSEVAQKYPTCTFSILFQRLYLSIVDACRIFGTI
jgi:hypothetical protein